MHRWIRRALTENVIMKGSRGTRLVEVEPSEKIVYGVMFAVGALIALTVIQVALIVVLNEPNDEITSAIILLVGTIMGVFFGKKA